MEKISYFEIEELACTAMGLTDTQTMDAIEISNVENLVYEKYEVSLENYHKIANDLIVMSPICQSIVNNEKYHAFVKGGNAIAKVKVEK